MSKNIEIETGKYESCREPSFESTLKDSLTAENLNEDTFNKIRTTPIKELDQILIDKLRKIRESVPEIESSTILQKIIAPSDLDDYLSGEYKGIRGFVSRWQDIPQFRNPEDVIRHIGLNYENSPFFNPPPKRIVDLDLGDYNEKIVKNVYAIRLKANIQYAGDSRVFCIPFGGNNIEDCEKINGSLIMPKPFTGNGFTSSDRYVIPESYISLEFIIQPQPFRSGDEIYEISDNGVIKLYAKYGIDKKWKII